jgi:vacuolar protein sorting-associated protein 35
MEEDQEKFLDDALKIVKSQAFHMNKTIENNQLRQCLKESSIMLSELKTSLLTPRNYYHLYTIIFDEMQYLEGYFKEEYRRGRKIKDLYDAVQQASSIIPRLYLLITVGSIYIESGQVPATEIMFDLLQMVKGVQNPLRGLFTRYYLLKMIKDKLPDKGNEFEGEKACLNDTLKFILQNLEEMNRLWIRLSTGCTGNDRLMREKERNELKVLVGENITRLASLQGLTLEIYREEVLPKIITNLLESKDQLSQQYLMECIIHAFPDDYNINCMNTILDTCTKLVPTVDIKSLFIALMEKLAKFVGDTGRDQNEVLQSTEKIFDLLKLNIDKIIEEGSQGAMDSLKLIELQVAFMKFTLKGCPNKLHTVNHILNSSVNILTNKGDVKLSQDGIKLIGRLLSVPLESTLSIFEMPQFPVLMNYLDFSSRSTLSLRIIESLVNGSCFERLNSVEKVTILLDFIKPLLVDSSDSGEPDMYQFEYEQQTVAKLIFIIHNSDPLIQYDMLNLLKNVFVKGGTRRKFTMPPLVNSLFMLASSVSHAYEAKNNNEHESGKAIYDDFIKKYHTDQFGNSNEYIKFIQKILNNLGDLINLISADHPETAFKLYLNGLNQINDLKAERQSFEESGYNFATSALALIQEGKVDAEKKLSLIGLFIGTITSINFFSKDNMSTITSNLQTMSQTLVKRSDQCLAMLSCSHLYFHEVVKDTAKVNECLTKAKRFAEFAMTNAQNLILFIHILNKYLFYIEKGTSFVKADIINDIIESVKNHIETIKNENQNTNFLPDIEKYFHITLEVIANRRKIHSNAIFDEIII